MVSDHNLVPSIERRLAAWLELKDKKTPSSMDSGRSTITISREFGCEAFPLSESVQQLFADRHGCQLTIFDRSLIERVSGEDNILHSVLDYVDQASLMEDLLAPLIHNWRAHEEAFSQLAKVIISIAHEGNAIIVGRGAAIITQKLDNCFHFRLQAPIEYRISSIAQRLHMPYDDARQHVMSNQKKRDQFIERFLTCDISDPLHYHAVFDNSRISIDGMAHCIATTVRDHTRQN